MNDPLLVEIRDLLRQLVDAQPRLAYDVRRAARMLDISESGVRRQVDLGLIRKVPYMGARVIIPHDELVRRVTINETLEQAS